MEKRKDDRDAKKSIDEATGDPWEANKDGFDQQAAELQVGEEDERASPDRFEPDPKNERLYPDPKQSKVRQASPGESKDGVDEP